ncbi:MAG: hypothetical protein H0U79_04440, partial [Solirubrobacterales bacterium]|nr:hypothetical protein [Solirubrobacterales bacterium]
MAGEGWFVARRRSFPVGLIVLALAVVVTGCGHSDDRAEARGVAERFFAAVESGDGGAACDQLSLDTRSKLEGDEQRPCREAIGELRIEPGPLAAIELFLTNAKADLENGESAFLSLTADGWRLSAVGCKPREGEPSEEPMDCELEA